MVTAAITFTQSAVSPGPGISMVGVGGAVVTLINADDTGVIDWAWELLDSPLNSALVPGVLGPAASETFTPDTPDTPGCYRIKLTVQGADGSVACDVKNFAVPTTQGWILPPFKATAAELNFPGNSEGWESLLNTIFLGISSDVANYAAPNLAGLTALVTGGMDDGAVIQVNTLKAPWRLDKTDLTTPVDGITVVASDTGARWFRQDTVDVHWGNQPAFYVNATTGADEADGTTSGTALATFMEWRRRVESVGVLVDMTVYIETDLPVGDPIEINTRGEILTIEGVPTVTYTGTVASFVQNPAANEIGLLNDAGWTVASHIHQHILFTSGAVAGYGCWILSDQGGGNARITQTVNNVYILSPPFPTMGTPAIGNTFVVQAPRQVWINLTIYDGVQIRLRYLEKIDYGTVRGFPVIASVIALLACKFAGYPKADWYGAYIDSIINLYANDSGGSYLYGGASRILYAGDVGDGLVSGSNHVIDSSIQANGAPGFVPITVANGAHFNLQSDLYFYGTFPGCIDIRRDSAVSSPPTPKLRGVVTAPRFARLYAGADLYVALSGHTITETTILFAESNKTIELNTDTPMFDVYNDSVVGNVNRQTPEVKLATLAALAAFRSNILVNGVKAWVHTLDCDFVLDTASTEVADGITIVTAVDGGRWIRQVSTSPVWGRQATWFINATTGSDEADGTTSGTALATFAEFRRRVEPVGTYVEMVVKIETDLPATDPVGLNTSGPLLTIEGVPTVVYSGTVNSFTQNPAGNEVGLLNDVGWTVATHILRHIVFTSGAVNTYGCWILSDQGGNNARVTQTLSPALFLWGALPLNGTPAVGDTFNVETFPIVSFDFQFNYQNEFRFIKLARRDFGGGVPGSNSDKEYYNSRGAYFSRCKMNLICSGDVGILSDCIFTCSGKTIWALGGASGSFTVSQGRSIVGRNHVFDASIPSSFREITTFFMALTSLDNDVYIYGNWPIGCFLVREGGVLTDGLSTSKIRGTPTGPYLARVYPGAKMLIGSGHTVTEKTILFSESGLTVELDTETPISEPHACSTVGIGTGAGASAGAVGSRSVGIQGALAAGSSVWALSNLTANATEVPIIVTNRSFARNLRVHLQTAPGVGESVTVTVYVNGIITTITAAITGAATDASDVTNIKLVQPGDRVSFRVLSTNNGAFAAADLSIALEVG